MTRLRIASPCDASWEAMRGSGRVRHCDACDKAVHDLTHVSERAASGFVRLRAGASVCARILVVGAAVAACGSPPHAAPAPSAVRHDPDVIDGGIAITPPVADPDPDADHDGIPDRIDACPGIPGTTVDDPKRNGCPNVNVVVSGEIRVLRQIHFAKSKTALLPESKEVVGELVAALKGWPSITKVEVGGYASHDEPSAQALSEKRAAVVVADIVAAGIDPNRLVAKGYAATKPIEDDKTEAGRAKNRRVEFQILEEGGAACAIDAGAP